MLSNDKINKIKSGIFLNNSLKDSKTAMLKSLNDFQFKYSANIHVLRITLSILPNPPWYNLICLFMFYGYLFFLTPQILMNAIPRMLVK